jgi:hypothetical protein
MADGCVWMGFATDRWLLKSWPLFIRRLDTRNAVTVASSRQNNEQITRQRLVDCYDEHGMFRDRTHAAVSSQLILTTVEGYTFRGATSIAPRGQRRRQDAVTCRTAGRIRELLLAGGRRCLPLPPLGGPWILEADRDRCAPLRSLYALMQGLCGRRAGLQRFSGAAAQAAPKAAPAAAPSKEPPTSAEIYKRFLARLQHEQEAALLGGG